MADAPATTAIVGVTVLVSALLTLTGFQDIATLSAGFVPGLVTGNVEAGPGIALLPVWITPLSATLVHGGFVHLALNMVMLVYCGGLAERALGWRLLALLYVVGAYAGAAGEWAQMPHSNVPMIGASGAISALIAAYALLYAERPVAAIGPIPSRVVRIIWLALAWIGIQLLTGLAGLNGGPTIAIGAHIGGFIAGLMLTRPMLLWHYRRA
jgi:membrane associated rhomboid family serine protease